MFDPIRRFNLRSGSLYRMMLSLLLIMFAPFAAAIAGELDQREGWVVIDTPYAYGDMITRLADSIKEEKMGLVTRASASDGAKGAGITIPGNRVMGVYRNDYARRMLSASLAAGIEAPIRYYVTENTDGTATLSYKTPTFVFSPYFEEGGDELRALASELDTVFESIANRATGS